MAFMYAEPHRARRGRGGGSRLQASQSCDTVATMARRFCLQLAPPRVQKIRTAPPPRNGRQPGKLHMFNIMHCYLQYQNLLKSNNLNISFNDLRKQICGSGAVFAPNITVYIGLKIVNITLDPDLHVQ